MIHLTKGQTLFNNTGMVVYDQTGYYEDGDPVICATVYAPDEPVCRFEARFIAYGDQVYSIGDEIKLMEEVKKIDPENLLGKTGAEVNVDKMVENITPEVSEDLSKSGEGEQVPVEENSAIKEVEKIPEPSVAEEEVETIPESSSLDQGSLTEPVVDPVVETILEPAEESTLVEGVIDNTLTNEAQ